MLTWVIMPFGVKESNKIGRILVKECALRQADPCSAQSSKQNFKEVIFIHSFYVPQPRPQSEVAVLEAAGSTGNNKKQFIFSFLFDVVCGGCLLW